MKIKKPSRKSLISKLNKIFSLYIRTRDSKNGFCTCITCGVKKPINEIHAGHFIPRTHLATRWDERNVNSQCAQCNMFRSGALEDYFPAMEQKYGRGVIEELRSLRFQEKKYSNSDLQNLIHHYGLRFSQFLG